MLSKTANRILRTREQILNSGNILLCSKPFSQEVNVIKSKLPQLEIPNILIDEYVWRNLDKWHDKTALVCLETKRSYTFYDVYKRSKSVARFLRNRLGLQLGDTVAVALPNIPEFAIAVLGSLEAGLKITTINPLYTSEEISKQLLNSDAKAVFTINQLLEVVRHSTKQIPRDNIQIISIKNTLSDVVPPGVINFEEMCNGDYQSNLTKAKWEDTAFLPYSSGTTGLPKGVELTHSNIVSNLFQMSAPDLRLNVDTEGSLQDVVPVFLPLFHIYGLVVVFLNMFSYGCKLITVPKFSSQAFMNLLSYRPTITYAVPPIILMILNSNHIRLKHLESIRYVVSAAAPLGGADMERFKIKTNDQVRLLQVYGLTETSPIATWQILQKGIKIGGSGYAIPNTECKIVSVDDPTNTGLGVGESGELLIRGPQNMKGYYKNEKATSDVLIENGWLRTGDIAHYDEDEHFFVTDRLKELIKVKGFQVAPAELEEILRDHPCVADAAVVGVPHPSFGEAPKGFVVLKSGTSARAEQLQEYVASKVASYKKLTGGVAIIDKIPKNASGKLLRRELKNM